MNVPIEEVLVYREALAARVDELAAQITHDYEGKELLLVGVLKGAVFFMADLARRIDLPVALDFMAVSSYGSSTDSSGVVRILKDLDLEIAGRDVLIVEDIIDSGLTLSYLLKNLRSRKPASLEICALLTKPVAAAHRDPVPLRRLRDPRQVRGRLRPRPRRPLPHARLHRGPHPGGRRRHRRLGGFFAVIRRVCYRHRTADLQAHRGIGPGRVPAPVQKGHREQIHP